MTAETTLAPDIWQEAVDLWQRYGRRETSVSTERQYRGDCRRLAEAGEPSAFASPDAFYKRRAALVWAQLKTLDDWMTGRDVSPAEVRGAVKWLRRYPPGAGQPDQAVGGRRRRQRRSTAAGGRPKSKDHVGCRLHKRIPDWRRRVLQRAVSASAYPVAIAVLMATGVRPAELAKGVRLRTEAGCLRVDGAGAKACERRATGQPQWRVWIALEQAVPEVAYLRGLIGAHAVDVAVDEPTLRREVKRATIAALGDEGLDVSPYVFRHDFAAGLPACRTLKAFALHHASCRSTAQYGNRSRGARTARLVSATGTRAVAAGPLPPQPSPISTQPAAASAEPQVQEDDAERHGMTP
ncbi:site-specific integrase [Rhodovibrio sodomensis]|uniref:site-specific integrase n=1 Tax=Rhodovibrio sodomensis TaxID=1088 RepID=UPI001903088A|nr:site-specific integrase [Rhodovibrio sodomensis]